MPRIIFKCPYIRGGARNTTRLSNYVRYVSTREGVEKVGPDTATLPATKNQRALVRQLTKDFPQSKSSFEYEDFRAAPTRARASEYISRTMEDNAHQLERREIYVRYISERPRVQRVGSHGLFTGSQDAVVLSRAMEEVANHPGNVWTPIISLRREDAARLGYDNAESWRSLLTSFAPEIAKGMKIPLEQFRWYAAYHDEGSHPHVHMVCYSADPKKGFLTKDGLDEIRSKLANQIFRQELLGVYQKQTQRRDELSAAARETLEQLIGQMQTGVVENETVGQLLEELSERLQHTKGKKQYGYLPPAIKAQVDELVDELAKDPKVAKVYALWYELREDVLRTYKDEMPERLPLSQQKEFKSIKNIVIREAVRLGGLSSVFCEDTVEDEPEPEETDPERLKRSAESGSAYTQYTLGKLYRDGVCAEKDLPQAAAWFWKAAEQGNSYAAYALGKLLQEGGEGLPKNVPEAAVWFQKAAEDGNLYAQYRLGKLLLLGDDVPKDVEQALRLLTASAEQGNQYAQYALGKLFFMGKEIPKDREAAIRWFTLSAEQGNTHALYFLQHMDDWRRAAISQGMGRLLHHLGNLFRAQTPPAAPNAPRIADKKLLRKIREKQAALGIKSGGQQQQY